MRLRLFGQDILHVAGGCAMWVGVATGCNSSPRPHARENVQHAAPPAALAFKPTPLDEIPAVVPGLKLLKASGSDWLIAAYYDYLRPDILHLTHRLPRQDEGRLFSQYDVHLYCNRGWPPNGINQRPFCDHTGRLAAAGERPICIYREERRAQKGLDPDGASIAWTDNGLCMMQFKHGLVSSPDQMKQAIAVAMDAATWMDQFVTPGTGPAPERGTENRRLLTTTHEIP